MAVFVGEFSARATAGSQSITGVGFQPVAVLFMSVEQDLGNPSNFLGAADANGNQWAMWNGIDDQASTYDRRYRELYTDRCIAIRASPDFTTDQLAAGLTSMDSDGFTLNFTAGGNAEPVYFMALGGLHIQDAHCGTFSVGASTGATAETGVGFSPRALVVAHTLDTAFDNFAGIPVWAVGFCDAQLNQYAAYAQVDQGSAVTGNHIHRTDAVACAYFSSSSYVAKIDSMDSDGFTVNVTDAHSANIAHAYLAIDASAAKVGTGTQPNTTGLATFDTSGFRPGGVLFTWNGANSPSTTGSTTMPVRPGVGMMDGVGTVSPANHEAYAISYLHRASASFGAYVGDAFTTNTGGIQISGGNGVQTDPDAVTDRAVAAFSAFDQGSFTINWTTVVDTDDRAFGWLALPGELAAPWIPRIIRRRPY